MLRSKKVLIIIILISAMVLGVVSAGGMTAAAQVGFQKTTSIKVAHISDIHYFPLRNCYNGTEQEAIFRQTIDSGYRVEISAIFQKTLADIANLAPDYLVVTGDLTVNGERDGHIDVANALRKLQNDIRVEKPNFQILVSPGNHDIYNTRSATYVDGKEEESSYVDRIEFSFIYESLGYPTRSAEEIANFYKESDLAKKPYLPYTQTEVGSYIYSSTSSDISIDYQITKEYITLKDVDRGELTYVAKLPDNYYIISIDEELSSPDAHSSGGRLFDNTKAFLSKYDFSKSTPIAILHHNVVPHFSYEDSLTKDFTLESWRYQADFLADLGVRYALSGHMHSHDIASHISFSNNQITDFETANLFGKVTGYRILDIRRGNVGDVVAEDVISQVVEVKDIDFSTEIDNNYLTQQYIEHNQLGKYMVDKKVADISGYAYAKFNNSIIQNFVLEYINPQMVSSLLKKVTNMIPDNVPMVSQMKPLVAKLADNLLEHVDKVILKDYVYGGSTAIYKSANKIYGYLEELVNHFISMPTNSNNLSIKDFVLQLFAEHNGSMDTSSEGLSQDYKEALANFRSGKMVKDALDILLDKDIGFMRIIDGILNKPIDLSINLTQKEKSELIGIGSMLEKPNRPNPLKDLTAVRLEDVVQSALPIVNNIIDIPIDLTKGIKNALTTLMETYLTDSLYSGLGEIAYEYGYSFAVDTHPDGAIGEKFSVRVDDDTATYIDKPRLDTATIENGKLPSMLTVNFGKDPATEIRMTYFTDPRVTDTEIVLTAPNGIQTTHKGTSEIILTKAPSIDMGIIATTYYKEIRRHTIAVSNLTPKTKYSYVVGSSVGYISPTYTFGTAPSDNGAFSTLLMTDLQGFSANTYTKALEALQAIQGRFQYDFVINCGDSVDNSENLSQYQYYLNIQNNIWANSPTVVAAGNHEDKLFSFSEEEDFGFNFDNVDTSSYNYLEKHYNYDLIEQDTDRGFYYSFDYSDVHFVVLNTNDIVGNRLSDKQESWLKNDLKTTQKKFKVVIMHKGIYTAGAHSFDNDVVGLRATLTPIFSNYNVNLVLQGHDHTYTESFYLDKLGRPIATDANSKQKIGDKGTLYVNLGTMGDKFYNYVDNDDVDIYFGEGMHNPTLSAATFGMLEYDGKDLYYTGYQYKDGTISAVKDIDIPFLFYALAVILAASAVLCVVLYEK